MRIALIGGIYGTDGASRKKLQVTPETLLEHGLLGRGHSVTTFGHYAPIDAKQFDLVHVHHLSYGAIRLATDNTDVPFLYTSHAGAAMSKSETSLARQIAARFVMSRVDALVALSRAEADFQERSYPLAGALHVVISNGVDPTNFTYARDNDAGRHRSWQLLYVGQLIALKKVDVLLRALAKLEQPTELTLVYQNAALEVPLQKLAEELGLSERVHFLGFRPPRELVTLYHRADVLVLPSAAEALPSVVTEAMFCGTPVIATNVGGVREQLGGYGVCIPPERPDELVAAISHVIDHYERLAAQSEAASVYARERFSIKNMVDRHLELYTNLLRRNGPRRRHTPLCIPVNAVMQVGVGLICATK